jgi:GT2 family glycosyltransferase
MISETCIITILYNSKPHLESFLYSWQKFEARTDLIFVDNASNDGSLEILDNLTGVLKIQNFVLLKNDRNIGFGSANNSALQYAINKGYKFVLLLNDDIILTENISEKLSKICTANLLLSPLQKNFDGNYEVNFQKFVGLDVLNSSIELIEVDFIQAASWFFSTEIFKFSNGYLFDDDFFHYGEDNEFCYRFIKGGGKIIVDTTVSLIHNSAEFNHKYPKDYGPYHLNRLRSEALISMKTGSSQHVNIIRRLFYQIFKYAFTCRFQDSLRIVKVNIDILRLTIKTWFQ